MSRASKTPSPFCVVCVSVTNCITASASRMAQWWQPPNSRIATSPIAFCRTRPSTWSTRPAPSCELKWSRCRRSSNRSNAAYSSSKLNVKLCVRKGTRLPKSASPRWKKNWPTSKAIETHSRPNGKAKNAPSTISRNEMEQAQRKGDLTRVAEYKYGKIPQLEQQLKEHEAKVTGKRTQRRLLQEEVTADEIAEVVSRWTGIPVARLLEGEKEKLLRLDQILHERVVGQDEAVEAVADAVIRARSGLKDPKRARMTASATASTASSW